VVALTPPIPEAPEPVGSASCAEAKPGAAAKAAAANKAESFFIITPLCTRSTKFNRLANQSCVVKKRIHDCLIRYQVSFSLQIILLF
jgi:hypothetical protein